MDPISAAIVRSATALSQAQLNQQVSYAVLRKAMDAEASTAAMLLARTASDATMPHAALGFAALAKTSRK